VHLETGPRYLLIDENGTGLACPEEAITTPAYKSRDNADALWKALARGDLDTIATDSAANLRATKLASGSVWKLQPSWQEMPTAFATLFTHGVGTGRLQPSQLAQLMSAAPARIFGLHPAKGSLAPGADADLVMIDSDITYTVDRDPHSACDYTPYRGWQLRGRPVLTMVRGRVVMRQGQVTAASGWGRAVGLA